MSYKILPPGNPFMWRIGTLGVIIRWSLTAGIVCSLLCIWYFVIHRPLTRKLFTQQAYICEIDLADLAKKTEQYNTSEACIKSEYSHSIAMLQLCEKSGLTVQTCSCQKRATKNNIETETLHLNTVGTLVQCAQLFTLFKEHHMPIITLECSLKKQQVSRYAISITCEYIPNAGQKKSLQHKLAEGLGG